RRRRGYAALGMAGGGETKLARSRAVEQPSLEHTVLDNVERPRRDTFAVEGPRAQPALAQRVVDDADARGEQPLAELVLEEARLAGDGVAVDSGGKMAEKPAGDPLVEHHRHLL